MKYIASLLLFVCSLAYAGPSTINATIPAANSALQSAPIRANFLAAQNDINNLIEQNYGVSAPINPIEGQMWINTTSTPFTWNVFDGVQWDTVGTINASTGLAQAYSINWAGVTNSPTTLSGYGITNAVSSVSLTMPSIFTVTGSPITGTGTFVASLNNQPQGNVFAAPSSSTGAPTFRALVKSDLPAGTLLSTTAPANNPATGTPSSTTYLRGDGTWAQPGFGNLSGSATCSQLPSLTGDATTSAGSCATTVSSINGTSLAGLSTGILKNTTSTGAPSIAVVGTDYVAPSGSVANMAGGTAGQITYQSAPSVSGFFGPCQAGQSIVGAGTASPTCALGVPYVDVTGTSDAIIATYSPAITTLYDGETLAIGPAYANATTSPTLQVNSLTAYTIYKNNKSQLVAGDIPGSNAQMLIQYSAGGGSPYFILINPAVASSIPLSGITGAGTGVITGLANAATGSGSPVLATSPTLVTPALGTPTALVGTNITGTGSSFTAGAATNIAGASTNSLPYQTGTGSTGFMTTVNNAVVVTGGGGVPSESVTLPSGISATNESLTTPTVKGYIESACTPTITAGAITITVTSIPTGCSTISTLQKLSIVTNTTVTLPAPSAGVSYSLLICASGAYSPIFAIASGNLSWPAGSIPTSTATSGKCDLYSFVALGSSYLFGSAVLNFTGS